MESVARYLINMFKPATAVMLERAQAQAQQQQQAAKQRPFVIERLIAAEQGESKQITVGLVAPDATQAIRIGPLGSPVFSLKELKWKSGDEEKEQEQQQQQEKELEYSFAGDVKLCIKKNLDKTVEYTVTAPNFKQSDQMCIPYKIIALGSEELDEIAKLK